MRRRQDPPQITITYVDEKADLGWVTSMLVRWSHRVAVLPPHCTKTAGTGTPVDVAEATATRLPHHP
jgi:hypothetical protein